MKIGVTGDTHGSIQAMRQILQVVEPVDYWFHTGDFSQDAGFLPQNTNLPLLSVAGNCDGSRSVSNIDEFITLEGLRIWLTHGHRYMPHRKPEELAWWGKKLEADIVVFGHTHIPFCQWFGSMLLFNPGSPASPRGAQGPSYGILTLQEGEKPTGKICLL